MIYNRVNREAVRCEGDRISLNRRFNHFRDFLLAREVNDLCRILDLDHILKLDLYVDRIIRLQIVARRVDKCDVEKPYIVQRFNIAGDRVGSLCHIIVIFLVFLHDLFDLNVCICRQACGHIISHGNGIIAAFRFQGHSSVYNRCLGFLFDLICCRISCLDRLDFIRRSLQRFCWLFIDIFYSRLDIRLLGRNTDCFHSRLHKHICVKISRKHIGGQHRDHHDDCKNCCQDSLHILLHEFLLSLL